MREYYKSIKPIFLILIFFILISFVYADTKECHGTTTQDDIPCWIILPHNTSSSDCLDVTVNIFRNNSDLLNLTMSNYTSFSCNATFNETATGSYVFRYSTGDSGSINVVEGSRMILLFYFALIVIIGLVIFGVTKRDVVTTSMGAIGLMVFGIFLHVNGFNNLTNLITEFLALLFIMLGLFFMIPLFQWAVDEINLTS